MNPVSFKHFLDHLPTGYLKKGTAVFLADLCVRLGRFFTEAPLSDIEIGFETRHDLRVIKVTLICLPVCGASRRFLNATFSHLKRRGKWHSSCRDFDRVYARIAKVESFAQGGFVHFGFEIREGVIQKVKFHFSPQGMEHTEKILRLHSTFKIWKEHAARFSLFPMHSFCVEYLLGSDIPDAKVYVECLTGSSDACRAFFRLLDRIRPEGFEKEASLKKRVHALLQDRYVRKIKKGVVKDFPDRYVKGFVIPGGEWRSALEDYVKHVNGYYAFLAFGDDGLEVFIR
jgi:hypothetical protein